MNNFSKVFLYVGNRCNRIAIFHFNLSLLSFILKFSQFISFSPFWFFILKNFNFPKVKQKFISWNKKKMIEIETAPCLIICDEIQFHDINPPPLLSIWMPNKLIATQKIKIIQPPPTSQTPLRIPAIFLLYMNLHSANHTHTAQNWWLTS